MSWDNNNLACILVFPPWQRQGLGKILMGVSYELSRREGRVGGPEKPLSEFGRRGYMKFWQARVAREFLDMKHKSSTTVEDLARTCWMTVDDVILALKEMGVLESRRKGAGMLVLKSKVTDWARMSQTELTPPVDEAGFLDMWMPTFTGDAE